MHFVSAVLTHKHQPSMRTVPFTGMTAARTHLGRVMSIHLHGHRPVQRRFISKECLQFSKAPLAPVAFVCTGFFRGFGVRTPLSTVTDIRQLLKPDERLGEATKNTEAQLVVPVSDKPSFSPAYLNQGSAPENPSSGFKRLSHFQKFSPGIAIPQGRMRPNSVVPGAEFSA